MIRVKNMQLTDHLSSGNHLLLTYDINYPQFDSECKATSKVNKFYQTNARILENYSLSFLYPQAVSQYHYSLEHGYPVMSYEAYLNYTITSQSDCIISLYQDRYTYTGGAHGSTLRRSQTWNLNTGHLIRLKDFFPKDMDYEHYLLESIITMVEKQIAAPDNPDKIDYFDNYLENIPKSFREGNFYLTPTGIIIYFQQYDLAPYSNGIVEFYFPFPRK